MGVMNVQRGEGKTKKQPHMNTEYVRKQKIPNLPAAQVVWHFFFFCLTQSGVTWFGGFVSGW